MVGLVVGGSNALGSTASVRVRVAPSRVTAGQRVVVTADVSQGGASCSGRIGHARTALKLGARRASGSGAVSWKQKIPASAAGGTWTASVSCVHAGRGTAHLTVTPNDFTVSADASSAAIAQGGTGTSKISVTYRSGSAQTI